MLGGATTSISAVAGAALDRSAAAAAGAVHTGFKQGYARGAAIVTQRQFTVST